MAGLMGLARPALVLGGALGYGRGWRRRRSWELGIMNGKAKLLAGIDVARVVEPSVVAPQLFDSDVVLLRDLPACLAVVDDVRQPVASTMRAVVMLVVVVAVVVMVVVEVWRRLDLEAAGLGLVPDNGGCTRLGLAREALGVRLLVVYGRGAGPGPRGWVGDDDDIRFLLRLVLVGYTLGLGPFELVALVI
jgi:hypothetical protein